jgi:hypothetical protein
MTQSDFITQLLRQILGTERELLACAPEYREMVVAKRNTLCGVLRIGFNDKDSIENAADILGELRAEGIDQEISNIMGVNYVRRSD